MTFKKEHESGDPDVSAKTKVGVSTKPGASVMDQLDTPEQAQIDFEALNQDAPELSREPQQVKEKQVLYMPRKDFSARINQTEFQFRSGVQTRVDRDMANMLCEDESRGYVKD